jgi:hypothetical protein
MSIPDDAEDEDADEDAAVDVDDDAPPEVAPFPETLLSKNKAESAWGILVMSEGSHKSETPRSGL